MNFQNLQTSESSMNQVKTPRQDLGGGQGVFSNFFDELADDEKGNEDISISFKDETNDFSNELSQPILYNDEFDQNPRISLYEMSNCDFIGSEYSSFFMNDNQTDHNENRMFLNYTTRKKIPKVLINRYLLGSTFGRGSYGKVKDCLDLKTYRRLAAKIVSKHAVRKIAGGWTQAINEAAILLNLPPSRHTVRLIQPLYLSDPDRIALVMEYCLGSIHDLQSAGVPPSCLVPESMSSTLEKKRLKGTSMNRISTEPTICVENNDLEESVFQVNEDQSFRHNRTYSGSGQASQFRRLTEAQSHAFFLQILSGIDYLHSQRVIHRDIKPGNLLVTSFPGCGLDLVGINVVEDSSIENYGSNWSLNEILKMSRGYLIKITDFGVSTTLPPKESKNNNMIPGGQMTLAIQPPEVAKGEQSEFNGRKLDIYSAGVSLFFMITGHVPFSTPNVLQMLDVIVNGSLKIPGHVSVDADNLIRGMMLKDPSKRFSIEDIWKHPWVIKYPRSHPTKEKAIEHSLNYWRTHNINEISETTVAKLNLHGYPIWLDPLEYLKRPLQTFPLPHIDESGSRIFSPEECEEFLNSSGQEEMNPITHMTTLDRFSTYLEMNQETNTDPTIPAKVINIPGEILANNSHLIDHQAHEPLQFRSIANAYEEPLEQVSKKFAIFNLGLNTNTLEKDSLENLNIKTRCRHHSSIVTDTFFEPNSRPEDLPVDDNSDQFKTALTLNSLTKDEFQRLIHRLESQRAPKRTQELDEIYDSAIDKYSSHNHQIPHQNEPVDNYDSYFINDPQLDMLPNRPKIDASNKISSWFRSKFTNAFNKSHSKGSNLNQINEPEPIEQLAPTKKVKRKLTKIFSKSSFRQKQSVD